MKLQPGQIFRKAGPQDWMKINIIQLPGYPDYDGGSPGVFFTPCTFSTRNNRLYRSKKGFFQRAADEEDFLKQMKRENRKLLKGKIKDQSILYKDWESY